MALVVERWVDAADVAIVAGDPDQTINAYAGADPRFFELMHKRVDKELPVAFLPQSFRCPDEHYEAAKRMLSEARDPPALETAGAGVINEFHPEAIDHDDSGAWSLPHEGEPGSPVWLWEEHGPDMIVEARTQRQLTGVAACLDLEGVAYESQDTVGGDWESRFQLLRALQKIENVRPGEQSSIVNTEFDSRDESEYQDVHGVNLTPGEAYELVSHVDKSVIDDHGELLTLVNDARREDDVVPVAGIGDCVTDGFWERYTEGRGSVGTLVRMSSEAYSPAHERATLIEAWARYEDRSFNMDVADGTRLLTCHAAKGSEATDVVLYDGITGRTRYGIREHRDVKANEARTWYVALTRASERLHIVRGGHAWVHEHLPVDLGAAAADAALRAADNTEVIAND